MVDLLGSLKTVAEDRIKSPVFGTAVFLLCVHEWRILAILLMSYKYPSASDLLVAIEASYSSINVGLFLVQYTLILFGIPILGICVDLAKSGMDVLYKNVHNRIQGYEMLKLDDGRALKSQMLDEKNKTRALLEGVIAEKKELEEKAISANKGEEEWKKRHAEAERALSDKAESFAVEKAAARRELQEAEKKVEASTSVIESRTQERNECYDTIQRVQSIIANKISEKKLDSSAIKSICNTLGVFYVDAERYGKEFTIDGQTIYSLEKVYDHISAPSYAGNISSSEVISEQARSISISMNENESGFVEPFISAVDRSKIGIIKQSLFDNPLCHRYCIQNGLIEIITEVKSDKSSDRMFLLTPLGKECHRILKHNKRSLLRSTANTKPPSAMIAHDQNISDDLPF